MKKYILSAALVAFSCQAIAETKQSLGADTVTIGAPANTTKKIIFNKGAGSSNPGIRYNSSTGVVEITTNGSTWIKIATTNDASPVGLASSFVSSSCPSGWLALNGSTIGSASSGATSRANADTAFLYEKLWNDWSNANLPIQDSSGAASTRGASAAADFAANKRLPLPNTSGIFVRGSGSQTFGSQTYTGTFGNKENDQFESHTHVQNAHTHADSGHFHGLPLNETANPWGNTGVTASGLNGTSITSHNTPRSNTGYAQLSSVAATNQNTGGTETNPANISLLYCVKY